MYQYRQVLGRMRQGDSDRVIARSGLMGRRKAAQVRMVAQERGWLAADAALPDDAELAAVLGRKEALPANCTSTVEPWRAVVTAWHAAGVQHSTIHGKLRDEHGFQGSYSAVNRFVGHLESEKEVAVSPRLVFKPAEAAQVDFGAGPPITDAVSGEQFKTWFFVMTLAWSRHQYAEMVRDQSVPTWLGCHRRAFEWFGGVPQSTIIDNPKCAITKACYHDPQVQRAYGEYALGYGFRIDPCPVRDPKKKGIVESGVKYIKRSFLALREFRDLADANRQLRAWVLGTAGNRVHGTTGELPLRRFAEVECPLLNPLPAVPPECADWALVKVESDGYVRYDSNHYSVPFRLARQTLWLRASDAMVTLFLEHASVAAHVRAHGRNQRLTVGDHLSPAAQEWLRKDPEWCAGRALEIGPACAELVQALMDDPVLVRKRAIQGVLGLEQKFGPARLEAACLRANQYGTRSYNTVRTMLEKGLDTQTLLEGFDAMSASCYAEGGVFCREIRTMLQ